MNKKKHTGIAITHIASLFVLWVINNSNGKEGRKGKSRRRKENIKHSIHWRELQLN